MNTTGIYELLITQLVEWNLDRDTFYVGERTLETGEAATLLSRFLTHIIEFAMDSVPNGDSRIHKQIKLANTIVQCLVSIAVICHLMKKGGIFFKIVPILKWMVMETVFPVKGNLTPFNYHPFCRISPLACAKVISITWLSLFSLAIA
jgi:hypothetical protein